MFSMVGKFSELDIQWNEISREFEEIFRGIRHDVLSRLITISLPERNAKRTLYFQTSSKEISSTFSILYGFSREKVFPSGENEKLLQKRLNSDVRKTFSIVLANYEHCVFFG